jgi:amphi-Trp domain-containing protein
MKKARNVEKSYANADVAKKLRRLADALEGGTPFLIQIGGKRVRIPAHAKVEFEYEKQGKSEEVEIEVSWEKK